MSSSETREHHGTSALTGASPAAGAAGPGANIDREELGRFERVAHQWWDPQGDFRPLHDLNPARSAYVARQLAGNRGEGLAGARVLDIGCGGGLLAEAMAAAGAEVLGIDPGTTAIQVARLHAMETGATPTYRQCAVEEIPTSDGGFDLITCMELLEHVPEPASVLAHAAALLRPGGTLVLSTINRTPRAYAMAVLGAEYVLRLLPRGTHDYAKFIRPSELAQMTRRCGLQVTDIVGMHYNPFTRACRIEGSPDVNYLLTACKPETATPRVPGA